jgi:hypothetical protein
MVNRSGGSIKTFDPEPVSDYNICSYSTCVNAAYYIFGLSIRIINSPSTLKGKTLRSNIIIVIYIYIYTNRPIQS